mmetsp:Transcript_29986/g.72754  ORF Transcript_29986/g.72754 Transcript_29986/m.72754 type:complete len:334 (+) Transcript_29986:325-1326(+)
MGQICSGTKGEANKGSALEDVSSSGMNIDATNVNAKDHTNIGGGGGGQYPNSVGTPTSDPNHRLSPSSQLAQQQQQHLQQQMQNQPTPEEKRRLIEQRKEQQRLDIIVQTAGRGMVPVRSTRGSNGYYDQGFAAALRQHLEQTTTFEPNLPIILPPPSKYYTTSASLSSPSATSATADDSGESAQPTPANKLEDTPSQILFNQLTQPSPSYASSIIAGVAATTSASTDKTADINSNDTNNNQQGGDDDEKDEIERSRQQEPDENATPDDSANAGSGDGGAGGRDNHAANNDNAAVLLDPNEFMGMISEQLLDAASKQSQTILSGVKPVVENLL